MKLFIAFLSLMILSCSDKIEQSTIEITYYNGDVDTLTVKHLKNCISLTSNGCLFTATGDDYVACGVRKFKVLK